MNLAELAEGPPLDLAVIGGGINGCAIARGAAMAGLRVAVFEADDFGFGTTWRSTKLIHGGLRYLEHGDVRLVFESLRERAWLLRTRRHLVHPLRFVMPVLPWTRRPAWQLRLGLTTYDLLAFRGGLPRHRHLDREALLRLQPGLPPETGHGFTFFDARAIAPERLALELALEARAAGAFAFNHARVTAIGVQAGQVTSITVEAAGAARAIPVQAVVNAAGPWVDAVQVLAGEARPLLGVTRGSHIVLEPGQPIGRDAVFSTAKSDGRVFFAIPQDGLLLVGTTDLRDAGDPGEVAPSAEEAGYLLDEAQALLPGLGLAREQIRYAYAGLRPLQRDPGGPEAAITRRHALIDHARQGGPRGLYSVVGGKLSTFRPLAGEVLGTLGHRAESEKIWAAAPGWRETLHAAQLRDDSRRHLSRYGPALPLVLSGGLDVICPHSGAVAGEIVHAVEREMATTLADILMRRSGIAWASCRGLCCHEAAAGLAAKLLGWQAEEVTRQVGDYEAQVARHLPVPGLPA